MVTKKRFCNQLVACILCVCMIFGLSAGFPVSVLASSAEPENPGKQMTDISGHWAESQVDTWVKKGLISGFPDVTFRPNNAITRAEFMALVNRAYGFTEKAAISFSDVSESDWFYDDVAKAVAAGYIVGYDDGTAGARNNISRQEAAAVIYRLMKLPEYSSKDAIAKFSDYGSISAWSREAVNSVVAEGYMVGNPNGTFGPVNNITRAETVVTLSRATGEIYNAAGTYSEVRTIKGNATINTTGITLDGAVVEGNLYLTPGIGDGTVVLRNVTVKGTTVIAGGGKNSVILEDCELNKVVVSREDGIVRVSAQGGTSIQIVVVEAGAILDSALLSEEGGILTVYVTADEAVELSGDFGTVHVENPGTVINVTGGSIENLIIAETAAGSSVNLSQTASVANMEINAPVTVTGQGTIENAVIGEGAKETTFEKEPVNKEGPGSTSPSTPPSTTPGGSTGGGGGQTSTTVNIAAISGIAAPVTGQTPVTTITETAQYSGTVAWSPADGSFAASTVYTATITLTAKSGYRLNGVAANFFTVAGATSVSNAANSGVITAVFPATAAPGPEKSVYDILFDPSGIVAAQVKPVDITLRAVEVKDEGYASVRINVDVTSQPSGSTVSLVGDYGAGDVDVIALGYWGPQAGHAISFNYDITHTLDALFSQAGQYTFSITLRDLDTATDIMIKTVNVTVTDASIPDTVVNIAAISGVTMPATGQTPVSAIIETDEYTGVVTWSPAHGSFAADTAYTATITLTAKSGYTLNGVAANFFTVAGATSVSNAANSGVITAVFPATDPAVVTYTLTYTAGPNGSLTGEASQTVEQGGSGTAVTAVPNEGYEFVNWSDSSTDNPRTDTNVTGSISVEASFAPIGEDPPVFNVDYPSVGSITDQGFRIYASADVAGIAYYIVVADGADAPTAQQVKNMSDYAAVNVLRSGSFYIPSGGQVNSSPVVALSAATNYDVYVVAETTGGTLQAAPEKLDVTTLVLQAPQFFTFIIGDGTFPRTENVGGRQLDIKAGFNNKPGKVFYILVPEGSQEPDVQQVIDGVNYGDVTLSAYGVFAVSSISTVYTETVTGLAPLTSYDIYLAAADNSSPMNINYTMKKLTATTLDSDEPAFNEGSPGIGYDIKEDGFTVYAGINKPGRLYMIVVAGGSAAPTSEQVKDGLNYGNATVLAKGSVEAPNPVLAPNIAEVKNLEPSTPYDVYVVAEDESGVHIQPAPAKLQVTTNAFLTGAPSMSFGYPVIDNTTDTGATVTVKTVRKANLYYMVLPGGSSISNSDVVAGQYTLYGYPAWHRQVAAGMIETFRDEEYQITIEGLDPGTEYRFYACPANWYNDVYVEGENQGTTFTTTGSAPPTADLDITAQGDDRFNIYANFATQNATAYYMVVPDGSPRPTYAQVKAGGAYEGVLPNAAGNLAMSAGGGGNALITGLAAASNYNVYVVFEASSNPNLHTTTPNRLDASTFGSQPPGMNVNVRQLGDTSFSLEASISKTGTIYYILVARDAAAPTSEQVKAGTGYSGVTIIKSGNISAAAGTTYTEQITGLTPDTPYDLYVAAEAEDILTGTPVKRQVQTLEPYAPEFNANSPYRIVRSDGFDIYGSLSRDGSVHYLVVPRDQTAPTAAQVKNPDGYAGTKSAYGSLTGINADTSFDIDIAGLTPDTQYDLYFVAEGTSGGLSTPVIRQYETLTALGFIEEPTVTEIRYYRFTVEGMLNRKCDVHYIVVPAGSQQPTAQQVKAGVDYGSVSVISAETVNNVLYYSRPVSGLEANRTYDMYMVFEETAGLSGFQKIEVTTAVVPAVAYSTFALASPRAYVSQSYNGVRLLVALNRPGTAYIARFADGAVPTQQQVIDKANSGSDGTIITITSPDVLYATIEDWNMAGSGNLYIVACDDEAPVNYILPSPQEITVLTE